MIKVTKPTKEELAKLASDFRNKLESIKEDDKNNKFLSLIKRSINKNKE